jgi:hypothetical protein
MVLILPEAFSEKNVGAVVALLPVVVFVVKSSFLMKRSIVGRNGCCTRSSCSPRFIFVIIVVVIFFSLPSPYHLLLKLAGIGQIGQNDTGKGNGNSQASTGDQRSLGGFFGTFGRNFHFRFNRPNIGFAILVDRNTTFDGRVIEKGRDSCPHNRRAGRRNSCNITVRANKTTKTTRWLDALIEVKSPPRREQSSAILALTSNKGVRWRGDQGGGNQNDE